MGDRHGFGAREFFLLPEGYPRLLDPRLLRQRQYTAGDLAFA